MSKYDELDLTTIVSPERAEIIKNFVAKTCNQEQAEKPLVIYLNKESKSVDLIIDKFKSVGLKPLSFDSPLCLDGDDHVKPDQPSYMVELSSQVVDTGDMDVHRTETKINLLIQTTNPETLAKLENYADIVMII